MTPLARTMLAAWLVLLALSSQVQPHAQSAVQPALAKGRFFWIGSDDDRPFTDEQLRTLVETASAIVLGQFYAGFELEHHHELARRVKAMAPECAVFAYMSATLIRPRYEWMKDGDFERWILRDRGGEKIVHKFQRSGTVGAWFADLSQRAYRERLARVAAEWMRTAPYDGLIFDACNFLHGEARRTFLDHEPPHPRARTPFKKLLSQDRMDAVNAGLEALFRETKAAIGDKWIVWNGFWRKPHSIERSLALLPLGDVALAERWCIRYQPDERAEFHEVLSREEILEDLRLVQDGLATGKRFFPKDTVDERWYEHASPRAIAKLARFGWAMYMLIHTPGRTSYGFSPGPAFSQNVGTDPVLLDVPAFGEPLSGFREQGELLYREFEGGIVYLNPGGSPARINVPRAARLLHGEGVPPEVAAGGEITVLPQDSVILLNAGTESSGPEAPR